ncbi:uncharacterized protein EV422DRAFT_359870 [Fimicolochytrium jonesii]|uniref:uncharacterized protein n=1 Tax=Fimicolochytrium jonesii TaxID=1396493 RepID=UPI0022FDC2B9|nr:uncharacterized protein EV422DRAFT_359870 [Fimicolochytrium jonesii]KAI8823544.1 hypothetical protein EV422DRAFT_359870 [Fimicolochytrium jonesii]
MTGEPLRDMSGPERTCGHKQCRLKGLSAAEIEIARLEIATNATDSSNDTVTLKKGQRRRENAKGVLLGGWLWCKGKDGVCEHGGWFHRLCCMKPETRKPCWWCNDCRPSKYHKNRIWKEVEGAIAAARAAEETNKEVGGEVALGTVGHPVLGGWAARPRRTRALCERRRGKQHQGLGNCSDEKSSTNWWTTIELEDHLQCRRLELSTSMGTIAQWCWYPLASHPCSMPRHLLMGFRSHDEYRSGLTTKRQ